MSTRYVWNKTTQKYEEKTRTVNIMNGQRIGGTTSDYTAGYISNFLPSEARDSNGNLIGWYSSGQYSTLKETKFEIATAPNFSVVHYFVPSVSGVITRYGEPLDKSILTYWYGTFNYSIGDINQGAATLHTSNTVTSDMDTKRLQFIEHYIEASGSPTTTKVSGSTSNSYSGSEYTYLGSDNIDPISISYPTTNVKQGDVITVSLTPSSGNTYGGTISYIYQYSLNGGSWTTIQTTTSTSILFNIPDGASYIQFRARAKDDMGFTSSDYVTGPIVTISSSGGTTTPVTTTGFWVGVDNKARKGTAMWVGVNGVARKVKAAWVGVNGVARKVYGTTSSDGGSGEPSLGDIV